MVAAVMFPRARSTARALVRRFGVEAPSHLLVEGFADRLGIKLTEAKLAGTTAQLVVVAGRRPQILLSDRLRDAAARRFTIAHELGHYVLEHPSRSIAELHGSPKDGRDLLLGSVQELEANVFAMELLMPESLVRPMCDVTSASLDPPLRIAYMFGVSVPTAASRFAELTPAACLVALSEHGRVRWTTASATFRGWVPIFRQLDPRSLAWGYFENGNLPAEVQCVPAGAWLQDDTEIPLREHSIASHESGTVLTLLTVPAETRQKCADSQRVEVSDSEAA